MQASRSANAGRIGLLAGYGRFPVLFAQAAGRAGYQVICVAIRDHASQELARYVQRLHWVGVARLGKMIRTFRHEGVRRVVMAGKVQKAKLFDRWRLLRHCPDWRFIRCYLTRKNRRDNRDDSLLLAVVAEYEKDGIQIESALKFCPELLMPPGCLTRRQPNRTDWADIAFGWALAKEMGRLDVGQTVAVKEQATLAVEAIEGTDQAILRAGQLCPAGNFTVVKVAKPQQDMRFDVPTIGPDTMQTLRRAGGRVLAVEAGKTILLDADQTRRLANQYGLTVIALRDDDLARWSGDP